MNFHLARYSYPNIRLHRIYNKMSDTISNKFNTQVHASGRQGVVYLL